MPTNSAAMKYNATYHLYVLEPEAFLAKTGIDYVQMKGSLTKARDALLQQSKIIYNYIYSFNPRFKKSTEYWLAFDEELLPIIQDVLEDQARFEAEFSASSFSKQPGVNVINGQQIPLQRFRGEARISPDVVLTLTNNKILYSGTRIGLASERDYTTDGY